MKTIITHNEEQVTIDWDTVNATSHNLHSRLVEDEEYAYTVYTGTDDHGRKWSYTIGEDGNTSGEDYNEHEIDKETIWEIDDAFRNEGILDYETNSGSGEWMVPVEEDAEREIINHAGQRLVICCERGFSNEWAAKWIGEDEDMPDDYEEVDEDKIELYVADCIMSAKEYERTYGAQKWCGYVKEEE